MTHADRCVLHYGKCKLTVPNSKVDNVATFYSASGFKKIKGIREQTLTTKQLKLMTQDEAGLRCEVAIAGNTSRRLWSLRSRLPISKEQAELEAKMYQRINEQSRIDFSGLGGTDNLHQETQEGFKHSYYQMQTNGEGNVQGKGKDLHSRASTLILRMDCPKDES